MSPDVMTYLKGLKPRCIMQGEDLITAHRHAAKVELAQHLLKMIEKADASDVEHEEL